MFGASILSRLRSGKINCKYESICWRHCYTKFFQENPGHDGDYPTRLDLCFAQCTTEEIMQPKDNGHTGGIYADVLPRVGEEETYCPALIGDSFELCHEYIKEEKKRAAIAKRKAKYYDNPNKRKRFYIAADVRRDVCQQQKFRCYYCERHKTVIEGLGKKMTFDHIRPRNLGGSDDIDNIAYCCYDCNSKKRAKIWPQGATKHCYNHDGEWVGPMPGV